MARPFVLTLPPQHYRELVQARDHAAHPDVRAHAAGILKVADGQSHRAVARRGEVRPHRPETVTAWIRASLDQGVAGLVVRSGRGRTPAVFPTALDQRAQPR